VAGIRRGQGFGEDFRREQPWEGGGEVGMNRGGSLSRTATFDVDTNHFSAMSYYIMSYAFLKNVQYTQDV